MALLIYLTDNNRVTKEWA